MKIEYKGELKTCSSPDYNYTFNMVTGDFVRWGKTFADDPKMGSLEIFDLEVSTICNGIGKGPCSFCYKSNTKKGENMSFATFKTIFDKLPKTLTQIAFGIGDIDACPDLRTMFFYCRHNKHNPGVVPNLTINGFGLTDEWANYFAEMCGGIAVSVYEPKDVCYDAVRKLLDAGLTQVTVHQLVSEETFEKCKEVINDAATDPRLKGLKAVMLLTLKPKGKRNKYHTLKDVTKYRELIDLAFSLGVNVGFDSCGAATFLAAVKDHKNFKQFSQLSESCESNRFSGYANVKGQWAHCSFTDGEPGWGTVNLLKIQDFETEVWQSGEVKKFRDRLMCQKNDHIDSEVYLCPIFPLYDEVRIGNASRKVIPIMEVENV